MLDTQEGGSLKTRTRNLFFPQPSGSIFCVFSLVQFCFFSRCQTTELRCGTQEDFCVFVVSQMPKITCYLYSSITVFLHAILLLDCAVVNLNHCPCRLPTRILLSPQSFLRNTVANGDWDKHYFSPYYLPFLHDACFIRTSTALHAYTLTGTFA